MKKLLILSLFVLITLSCSKSKSGYINPYLPNNPVNYTLDIRFYDALRYPHGSAVVYNQGAGGSSYGAIIVFNMGGDQYRAYDLMCPNHDIDPSCSKMTLEKPGSIYVDCYCNNSHTEAMRYSLITGTSMTPGAKYQMKPYPVVRRGDNLQINY